MPPADGCVFTLPPVAAADMVTTRTRVIVLQHPAEQSRPLLQDGTLKPGRPVPSTGTARVLELRLAGCTVARGQIFEPGKLPLLDVALACT
eukprot:SAG22_NODE_2788_length_2210_cov_1.794410_1_plen_90_part_10